MDHFLLKDYKSLQPNDDTFIYHIRALLAQNNTTHALSLLPTDSQSIHIISLSALANYLHSRHPSHLDQLRHLSLQVDDDIVRIISGTAFACAGQLEQALEYLGASTNTENLEAYVLFPALILY